MENYKEINHLTIKYNDYWFFNINYQLWYAQKKLNLFQDKHLVFHAEPRSINNKIIFSQSKDNPELPNSDTTVYHNSIHLINYFKTRI